MKISTGEHVELSNWSDKNVAEQPDSPFVAVLNPINRDVSCFLRRYEGRVVSPAVLLIHVPVVEDEMGYAFAAANLLGYPIKLQKSSL